MACLTEGRAINSEQLSINATQTDNAYRNHGCMSQKGKLLRQRRF
jgi:hypothetical protein